MQTLPCHHDESVTNQIEPTKDLLKRMDEFHPDVLLQHGIQPIDYHGGLVFRSAIESLRGTYISSSRSSREGMVADILENLVQRNSIHAYQHTANENRYDFEIALHADYHVAIDVKGGEGNSINISERPLFAKEFGLWCHLSGALVNQPAYGAHSIVNRVTNELVNRGKLVDVVFFKDILCGTRARPCPKYPNQEKSIGLMAAPDVFLFPQKRPSFSQDDPAPLVHSLDTLKLPSLVLDLFGVPESERDKHLWEVHVAVEGLGGGRFRHVTHIYHQGVIVDESRSRAWRPALKD